MLNQIHHVAYKVFKGGLTKGHNMPTMPRLYDVSLRDSLQTATPADYPTAKKQDMYRKIVANANIYNIEVGSMVNPKVLPIMADSIEMAKYAKEYPGPKPRTALLVPTLSQLQRLQQTLVPTVDLAFITSVSDQFQLKNTGRTCLDTLREFEKIQQEVATMLPRPKIKVYVSCIDQCPVSGTLYLGDIYGWLWPYVQMLDGVDNLCLSDTCGTLSASAFNEIMDHLCEVAGADVTRIGLHLHVNMANAARVRETKKILWSAFDRGIANFDVTCVPVGGGCSVTMKDGHVPMYSNLTYEYFMECWISWLDSNGPGADFSQSAVAFSSPTIAMRHYHAANIKPQSDI